jgi:hypothetical protein
VAEHRRVQPVAAHKDILDGVAAQFFPGPPLGSGIEGHDGMLQIYNKSNIFGLPIPLASCLFLIRIK